MKFEKNFPSILTGIVITIYLFGLVWWGWMHYFGEVGTTANYLFNIPMALSPLIVGSVLIISSLRKSRSVSLKQYPLYFGVYLFLWGFATIGTVYYNLVAKVEAPYPSLLDFSYIFSQISLLIAVVSYISVIRHWKYVHDIGQKIIFFGAAPIIQLILYWVVMQALNKEPFPDFSVKYVSSMFSLVLNITVFIVLYIFAFMLFFKKVSKEDVQLGWYLIAGITVQYIADYYFIFLITRNIFYIGHLVDLMFMTVYVCMSLTGIKIYKRMIGQN